MADLSNNSRESNNVSEVPLEMVNQPTVEEVDRIFIRKTVEYIQTLPGAIRDKIKIQTNTQYPSRYILMVSNIPDINLCDFKTIKTLAPQLRQISLSLKENWIKIDAWKQGANVRKIKRKNADHVARQWNLKAISKQDTKMLSEILDAFANLPTFPCQFHAEVANNPPNHYSITIVSNDVVHLDQVDDFKSEFRAFVKQISFEFSSNTIRLTLERASAPSSYNEKRKLVVYKRQKVLP